MATTTTAPRNPRTVIVGSADNGHTVTLYVGDALEIQLEACQDCGYSWKMTGQPNPVVFSYEGEQTTTSTTSSTSTSTSTSTTEPIVGQPVVQTWTFKAVSAHTTGFIAGYYPPGSNSPSQYFNVGLKVAQ